jgi:hypothetical protein
LSALAGIETSSSAASMAHSSFKDERNRIIVCRQ